MRRLRLTHPDLDFWVDLRLCEFEGRWLAVADFADEPDVGVREDPKQAVEDALMALGARPARELTASADLDNEWPEDAG